MFAANPLNFSFFFFLVAQTIFSVSLFKYIWLKCDSYFEK